MSEDIIGNNAASTKIPESAKAALQAQIDKFKAQSAGEIPEAGKQTVIAATPVQVPVVIPEPIKTSESENKTDSLQQFRNKEGNVDPAKVEKSTEHLQRGIQDKESRLQELLKQNKELQRQFTKDSQKLSEIKQTQAPVEEFSGKLTPELKRKLREGLEKEPEETLLNMMEAVAERKVKPFVSELETAKHESREMAMANELDSLVEDGHVWILTEGLGRFNKIFQNRPHLLQGATPFKDAMRFMPEMASSAQALNPAQVGMRTPILGSNHALPPPIFQAPVSAEQELKDLRVELEDAIVSKNKQAQREIQLKMDRAHRKAYPSTWY